MRKLIAVALVAFALPVLAHAKTLTLGAEAPVVTVDVPDAWNPQEYPNGMAATAPGNYLVTAEVISASDIQSKMEGAMQYFMDHGVEVDKSTEASHDMKINDFDVTYTEWQGKDKDGPAIVTISAMILNKEQLVLINTWGSPDADKADGDAILAMVKSIKPAE